MINKIPPLEVRFNSTWLYNDPTAETEKDSKLLIRVETGAVKPPSPQL